MIEANYTLKITDIKSQIDTKNLAKNLELKSLEDFYDLCIFNSITSLDLDVVIDGFLNSKHDWQNKFYARSMILILNEHLEKIHNLMNSKFYKFLSSNRVFNSLENEIVESKKSYKDLNRRKSMLSNLRNNTIGHRNENGESFYNSINNLDLQEIFNLVLDTQKILSKFTDLSTHIIKIIAEEFQEFYKEIKSKKL
ncbi:hypothetical protein AAGV33_05280 [Flavobacterium sp. FBOR7N2.3]|uniref:HEPN AbiU2-like domain-containing protein n=1 Tax=Flavobacterium magnesitis TaxID=3138077 RepID=A0ABV4TI77_9FLAO